LTGLGGMIHRDWVVGFDAFGVLHVGHFNAVLGAPMRFDETGVRRQDWDEPTDFGRVVGELAVHLRDDLFSARIGTISGLTLGTGAAVQGFRSTLDPDHWRTGATVALHTGGAGGDAFLDSVIAPALAGARVYVRPLYPLSPGGLWGRLEFGGTFAGDWSAPYRFRRDRDHARITLSSSGLPEAETQGVWAAVGDMRWPVVKTADVEVAPRASYVSLRGASGLHAGLDLWARPARRIRFGLAGEWRRLWAGNMASYFDGLYAIDRFDLGGEPQARLLDRILEDRQGMMVGMFFEWTEGLKISSRLELDQDGRANAFAAEATLEMGRVRAVSNLGMRGFETPARFLRPDRFMFAACLEVRILPVFWVLAAYGRDAAVRQSGEDQGLYLSSDSAFVGLRLGFGTGP